MKSFKGIPGYMWVIFLILVLLGVFMGVRPLAENFTKANGQTGGEVLATIHREQYELVIHRAVFDGLFGKRKEGFVQIDWKVTNQRLPDIITEFIDYDQDGKNDLEVDLNTKRNKALLVSTNPHIQRIGKVFTLGSGRAVRVILKN